MGSDRTRERYYTSPMSMGKRKRDRQPGDVGDDDGLADGRESSLLSSVESAAARARLRRLRRSAMCRLLRRHDGPPRLAPWDLLPTAADWLLRRHRLRARHRLPRGRFVG